MSAYSEYKCGAIDYNEFKSNMRRECIDYDPYDRFTCRDCASYKDCYEQVCKEGYPQCEEGINHEEYFEDAYEEFDNKTTYKKCIECRYFGYAVDSYTGEVEYGCSCKDTMFTYCDKDDDACKYFKKIGE